MERKSISEIRREFSKTWEAYRADEAGTDGMEELFHRYEEDSRAGVAGLIAKYQKELIKLSKERERLDAVRA